MLEILELQTGKTLKPLVRKIDLASSPAPADCLSALKKPRRHKFGSRETEIVERICRDNQFVERCLSALYDLQERQEKAAGKTIYKNGVGFNAADAQILGSMAQQILAGEPLTPAQLAICRQPTRSGISRLGQVANR